MSEDFGKRIRGAAIAGWWTWLIALAFFLLNWGMYITVLTVKPDIVLKAWGPGADWDQVQTLWFWFLAGCKVLLALSAFALLWLTLFARQLRRASHPAAQS